MKKIITILLIGALPALALAGGDGSHLHKADKDAESTVETSATEEHAHDAKSMGHDSKPHEHESVAGRPGNPADVTRTVEMTMSDTMRFAPDQLTLDEGETVRFTMQNDGQIPHEFVIGSLAELLEHAEIMRSMPDMQHAEANSITLQSGAKGDIVWKFDKAGTVDFACLIPGHLEAGMKGSVKVL